MAETLALEKIAETNENDGAEVNNSAQNGLRKINLIILGKQGSGKSSIFQQMHTFFERRYPDTIRKGNRLEVKNDKALVTVYDNSSQSFLDASFWGKCQAYVLVYDINDNSSFEYIAQMKDALMRPKSKNTPTITVVGNKKDLDVRAMRHEVADCIVTIDWELNYLEMSALYEEAEDTVPRIVRSLMPRTRITPMVSTRNEFDTEVCPRPRSKTDTRERRKGNKVPLDCVYDSNMPNGRLKGRASLPNDLDVRMPVVVNGYKKPNEIVGPAGQSGRRPSLISQLLFCVKDNNPAADK